MTFLENLGRIPVTRGNTPTLLIDGLVEKMKLRVQALPVPGLSRTLTVVAREGELHGLPKEVATSSRRVLMAQIEAQMGVSDQKYADAFSIDKLYNNITKNYKKL